MDSVYPSRRGGPEHTPPSIDPSIEGAQVLVHAKELDCVNDQSIPFSHSSSDDTVSSIREIRQVIATNKDRSVREHREGTKTDGDHARMKVLRKIFGLTANANTNTNTNTSGTVSQYTDIPLADAIRTAHTAAQISAARRRAVKRIATVLFTINAVAGITALVMFWKLSRNE